MKTLLILNLLLLIFCSSCSTRTVFTSNNVIPVKLGGLEKSNSFARFRGNDDFYLWGNFPSEHLVFVDRLMLNSGMNKIENITITVHYDWWTSFVSYFSLGMYTPIHYEITGYGKK